MVELLLDETVGACESLDDELSLDEPSTGGVDGELDDGELGVGALPLGELLLGSEPLDAATLLLGGTLLGELLLDGGSPDELPLLLSVVDGEDTLDDVPDEELSIELLADGSPLDADGVDGWDEVDGADEETKLLLRPLEDLSLEEDSLDVFDEDELSSLLLDVELLLSTAEDELPPLELVGPELDDELSDELELADDPELEDEWDGELLLDEFDELEMLELLDREPLLEALSLDWLLLEDGPLELLLEDELLELLLLLEGHSQSRTRRSKRHSLTLDTSRTVSVRLSTSMHSSQSEGVKRNSWTKSPGGGGSLELLLDSDGLLEELSLLELLELLLSPQSQLSTFPARWLFSQGPSLR